MDIIAKAWYLVKNGPADQAFELRDVSVPSPAKGQLRIKVAAIGINYADIMSRHGVYRAAPPLPFIPGYDVAGYIDTLGEDIEGLSVGDRVVAMVRFGGYSQYVVTDANAVAKLDATTPFAEASALAVQGMTAYYSAYHAQTLLPGEKILIHAAAGGVGTALTQLCKAKGCYVIGLVSNDEKAEYFRSQGGDLAINHKNEDYTQVLEKKFGEHSIDVIFDNVGGKSVQKAKSLLADAGRIVSYGAAVMSGKKSMIKTLRLLTGFGVFSPIAYLSKSQHFIGVNLIPVADNRPDMLSHCLKKTVECYENGILKPYVGKTFSFENLPESHSFIESRQSMGKIVVMVE